mgnify:CR=1 FL=1|jgi:hypothetical protein
MSHVSSSGKFVIKMLIAVAMYVKNSCPDCEFVVAKNGEKIEYRNWVTERGQLVGDAPLGGLYQLKLALHLKTQGKDLNEIAQQVGVAKQDIANLDSNPWDLATERKLKTNETFMAAYKHIEQNVIGKDAVAKISKKNDANAYEIGIVEHPTRRGVFVMCVDTYMQGRGILKCKGIGQAKGQNAGDKWAIDLKQGIMAHESGQTFMQQQVLQNKAYGTRKVEKMPNGKLKITIEGRQ